jgi:hypothetical protein
VQRKEQEALHCKRLAALLSPMTFSITACFMEEWVVPSGCSLEDRRMIPLREASLVSGTYEIVMDGWVLI